MMVRLIFFLLLYSSSVIDIIASSTVTFLHSENVEVKIEDPVHPKNINYTPQFEYPTSTVFQVEESEFHFYLLRVDSLEYYFWIEGSPRNIQVDLSKSENQSSNFILVSKSDWLLGNITANSAALNKLNEIDLFYIDALDSLKDLVESDEKFSAEAIYNTIVWDSRSSKRLYNLAVEEFSYQFEEKWIHYIPACNQYWRLMYRLYYQYFHTNSFKGLNRNEIKSTIEADFNYPESRVLVFHHFFKNGLVLNELKESYKLLENNLSKREKSLAEAIIQEQAVNELARTEQIEFLFGIDLDGAMEGYFARDSSDKKSILIFWSTWDSKMATEFNLLADLKEDYKKEYTFIHICIDSYESPERTKSFIYQNRIGGFHLLPEQSNAFRKSNFRKDQKIRDFPFYVLTDNSGEVIETESVPLQISSRLESKLKHFSTKK